MMTKKNIIIAVLVVTLFLGLVGIAWGLVYANVIKTESKKSLANNPHNRSVVDVTAKTAGYSNITAFELKERMNENKDNDFVILDIRDEASYGRAHIPGAINIPLKELGYRLFSLDKTKDIIVYCYVGVTSKIACQILASARFKDVYNLTGGIKAWNYAVETSDGRVSI